MGANNEVTFTADPNSAGNDSFQYTLEDENGDVSAPAAVQIGIGMARVPQTVSGTSAGVDLWSLVVLAGLPLLRRRRANMVNGGALKD